MWKVLGIITALVFVGAAGASDLNPTMSVATVDRMLGVGAFFAFVTFITWVFTDEEGTI